MPRLTPRELDDIAKYAAANLPTTSAGTPMEEIVLNLVAELRSFIACAGCEGEDRFVVYHYWPDGEEPEILED